MKILLPLLALLLAGCASAPPPPPAAVAVVPVGGPAEEAAALDVLQALRRAGVRAEMAYKGNLKRRMERANRLAARAALILGEDEAARGVVQLRDLDAGTQETLSADEALSRLGA